jgi:hypothetical protein
MVMAVGMRNEAVGRVVDGVRELRVVMMMIAVPKEFLRRPARRLCGALG